MTRTQVETVFVKSHYCKAQAIFVLNKNGTHTHTPKRIQTRGDGGKTLAIRWLLPSPVLVTITGNINNNKRTYKPTMTNHLHPQPCTPSQATMAGRKAAGCIANPHLLCECVCVLAHPLTHTNTSKTLHWKATAFAGCPAYPFAQCSVVRLSNCPSQCPICVSPMKVAHVSYHISAALSWQC